MMKSIKRYLPLTILLALIGTAYFSGLTPHLFWDQFQERHQLLKTYVAENFLFSLLAYIGFYTLFTSLAMPGPMFVTMVGGFLFPQPYSTLGAVLGATTGATCLFLIAKTTLKDFLERRSSYFVRVKRGFEKNRYGYLFFLRLVPAFPFWLVNLSLAFIDIPLSTFIWTTFFGLIPITFVFAQTGEGMGALLDSGQEITLNNIFNHEVKTALISLAIFAIIFLFLKKCFSKLNS